MRAGLLLVLLLAACERPTGTAAAEARLPDSDGVIEAFAPGAVAEDLLAAVDRGLATPGRGPDNVHFIVIRAGERHGVQYRHNIFHAVVGAGVELPEGALLIRRAWNPSGMIDGTNEQPQVWGLAVTVEPGAPRPYSAKVADAVSAFCSAVTRRVPVHPDCVLAMGEIPYTNPHEADVDEKALASAARAALPLPPAPGRLTIKTAGGDRRVRYELRNTNAGIRVGMMFRRGFDGEDRGMFFEYPARHYRYFWMRNCRIPIDLAYIRDGKIEQLVTMEPRFGAPQAELRHYQSTAAIKYALEMPAGWFAKSGVRVGDAVEFP